MTRALCYVELDIDYCSLNYGEAPCTASGGPHCFNTLKTCQDAVNFTNAPVTLRFAEPNAYLPKNIAAIPIIQSVSYSPAILSLGQDMGQRAKVSVTFVDRPHSDTGAGFDKYLAERGYDPFKRGSFWGKFRARQPYLTGRSLRLIRGFVGQALEEMETRHFIIESFEGPKPNGTYTLIAKDTLKLADGDRAQAPRMSNGFLVAGIDASETSATLNPSGIGDVEYPASGFVNIGGKEICAFTRSGDVLTLTRSQKNTEAQTHAANERVQLCLDIEAQTPAYIVHLLLTEYADIDPAHINLADWEAEVAAYYGRLCTAHIADPTPVNTLLTEIIVEAALALWWDDLAQELRLKVIRAVPDVSSVYSEEYSIMEGSLDSREQPDKRVSTVQTFFGKRNPLEGQDDSSNYLSCVVTPNLEAIEQYGSNAIKTIYSRWIPFGGLTVAERLNGLQLGRYRDAPRRFTFDIFRLSGSGFREPPIPGAGCQIAARALQDATGAGELVPIQLTSVNPSADRFQVEAEEMRFDPAFLNEEDMSERVVTIDVNALNINLRTLHDTIFPAPTDADVTNGVTLTCDIRAGAIVGSSSAAAPAFEVGTWPSGFILKIVNNGRILGKGGAGGNGSLVGGNSALQPTPGGAGGTAFYTRVPVDVENNGEIGGGGGGGGGGGRTGVASGVGNFAHGGGGGGGEGSTGGSGGPRGTAAVGGLGVDGSAGTPTSAGAGGNGGVYSGKNGGKGGNGGGLGQAGASGSTGQTVSGQQAGPHAGAAGGQPGPAVDGHSFVSYLVAGTIAGAQIN